MSVSVDDLISSFSSNHIGQEAIDLATLQAQLAQTLFGQPISSPSSKQQAQPCNTPTSRTPSGFSWGQMAVEAQQQTYLPSIRTTDEHAGDADEMEEDERMVEDLLVPSSPMTPSTASSTPFPQQYSPLSPIQPSAYAGFVASATENSPSLFTSTDPFYIAQLQAAHNHNPSPQSVFSQNGRPTQQSPFVMQQHQAFHRDSHGYVHSTPSALTSVYPIAVGDNMNWI